MQSMEWFAVARRLALAAGVCMAGGLNLAAQDKGVLMVEMELPYELAELLKQSRAAGGSERVEAKVSVSGGVHADPLCPRIFGAVNSLESNPRLVFGPVSVKHGERRPITAGNGEVKLTVEAFVVRLDPSGGELESTCVYAINHFKEGSYADFRKALEETGILLVRKIKLLEHKHTLAWLEFLPLGVTQEAFAAFLMEPAAAGAAETKASTKKAKDSGITGS